MNKKDINLLKKEFNIDTYKLKIKELYSVYLKKDNKNILFADNRYFDALDMDTKELFLGNFKKILTGALDTKLFELNFKNNKAEANAQQMLNKALLQRDINGFGESMDSFIIKISENFNYDMDIVINFIRAEYYKGSNKKKDEYDEALDDTQEFFEFILGSINKVDIPKKTLVYDFNSEGLRANSNMDISINVNAPVEGFMFPAFENGFSNVNKVLYYTSKPKDRNIMFIEEVLDLETSLTAEEERETFNEILNTVTGGKVTPAAIQEIYEELKEKAETEEEGDIPTLGVKEIENILESKNIEIIKEVETAYEEVLCTMEHEFKIENLIPKFNSKSIKIANQDADIVISPNNLNSVRQVKDKEGNKCLLIKLTEDVIVNGIRIEMEEEI